MYASGNRVRNPRWNGADYDILPELGMYTGQFVPSRMPRHWKGGSYAIDANLGGFLDSLKQIGGQLVNVIVPHPATGAPTAVQVPAQAPNVTGLSLAEIGKAILTGAMSGAGTAVAKSSVGQDAVASVAREQTAKYATAAIVGITVLAGMFLMKKGRR